MRRIRAFGNFGVRPVVPRAWRLAFVGLVVIGGAGCAMDGADDEAPAGSTGGDLDEERCRAAPWCADGGASDSSAREATPQSDATAPPSDDAAAPVAPAEGGTSPAPLPTPQPIIVTRTATDCSRSAVQAAVDAAADGEVVGVPAGTCTWSAAVSITKSVSLKGAGAAAGGTKIVYGGSNHPLLDIQPGNKKGRVDVSGFWFQGGHTDYWNGTAIQFGGPEGWKNLRIHHNVFDGNGQWTIKGSSHTHGLIDNNVFKGTAAGIMLYGSGAKDWSSPLVLGTADFFFVENNTFTFNDDYGSTKHPVMDMNNGGRQVFRHNKVSHGLWETHDLARSGLVSANAYEIYGNEIATSTNQWKGLDISAGTGVVWGNTFTGDISVPIGAIDYKSFDPRGIKLCDGTDPADQNVPGESGWRCQYQIGSMGEGPSAYSFPLFVWSNTYNGASVGMACTSGCNHVKAGRDFINNGTTPKPGYTPYPYPHPLAL